MQGDIILEMNDQKMSSDSMLRNEVAMLAPGTKVNLLVYRDGKKISVVANIAEKTESATRRSAVSQQPKEQLGLQLQNLTKDFAERFGYALGEGVLVTQVTPGSQADEKGIQSGDLVVSINGKKVKSVNDFTRLIREFSHDKKVRMLIKHGQYPRFIVFSLE